MGTERYDLVAIGGGTAGLVTAAVSAALGARTALVERDRLGGECLWTGCVPSKALIGSARIAEALRSGGRFGLDPADPRVDRARVLESVRAARARVQPHDDPERFRDMGVDVVPGEARFVSGDEIEVDGRRIRSRRFVIATGSRPDVPPVEGLEEAEHYTHETAFDRDGIPGSVLVLGAGPIGIEFAQAYRRLGVEVTVLELEDRILVREEAELATRLRGILEAEGVAVRTSRRVARARAERGRAVLEAEGPDGPETFRGEAVLVATGRKPGVEGLELDRAGVETTRSGVVVDDRLRTTADGIYAAGDVTGGLLFTHVADHEARTVVRNALFPGGRRIRYGSVPWCTYTEPALAHVGLTEAEAREARDDVRVYTYDLEELDRAIVDRATGGCVKVVADGKGRILGGHVLAPQAGTMIVELAMAMEHGIGLGDLSRLVHPYPTYGEAVRRAADAHVRSRLTARRRAWLGRYFALARRLGL